MLLIFAAAMGKHDGHRVVWMIGTLTVRVPGKPLQLQGVATGAATDALPVETVS
ncbi:MAG TPA: hypothetical protein VE054_16670 [Blattabacteriaceae bacterium]|jgi:hypothetical protein|nr:hypothetical protein [Blattabacteriaceae bacterium]